MSDEQQTETLVEEPASQETPQETSETETGVNALSVLMEEMRTMNEEIISMRKEMSDMLDYKNQQTIISQAQANVLQDFIRGKAAVDKGEINPNNNVQGVDETYKNIDNLRFF